MPRSAETSAQLGLLQLVQWLSPAFPTGAFAYSHGLEFEVLAGRVTSAVSLGDWLRDVLGFGAGWQDAVLLSQALELDADLVLLAGMAQALAPSAERLSETMEQGTAFARATSALTGLDLPACALPVAVGQAARTLSLPKSQVIALYLHGFAANLVSAAVRFVPLGQTEGQGVLAGLHPVIENLASKAATATLDDLASATLRADLASMHHETMPVRIFRT
jgi:urease accessory protein